MGLWKKIGKTTHESTVSEMRQPTNTPTNALPSSMPCAAANAARHKKVQDCVKWFLGHHGKCH